MTVNGSTPIWRARIGRSIIGMAIMVAALLVIAAHLLLLPESRWTGDEYELLATTPGRVAIYFTRVFGWSPRPVSEALIGLYAVLVDRFRRPLIAVPLALCWAAMLAAPFLGWRLAAGRTWTAMTASLVVTALLLLAAKPGEVFYWPGGSLAYLPTLAVASFVVVFAAGIGGWGALGNTSMAQRVAVLMTLIVGAGSSEIGACFALFLAIASCLQDRRQLWRTMPVLVPPAALGLAILLAFATHRGQGSELMLPGSPTFQRLGTSLIYSARTYIREFVGGLPPFHDTMDVAVASLSAILGSLALRGLIFYGLAPPTAPHVTRRLNMADFAPTAALLAAGFVSLFTAYYHFGIVCCERHETMRQGLFMLATGSAAAAVPGPKRLRYRGPALLAALIILMAARLPDLRNDYALMHNIIAAKSATWLSGRGPGTSMVFVVGPQPRVAGGGWYPPAGLYHLNRRGEVDAPDGVEIARALKYFGKTEMLVR